MNNRKLRVFFGIIMCIVWSPIVYSAGLDDVKNGGYKKYLFPDFVIDSIQWKQVTCTVLNGKNMPKKARAIVKILNRVGEASFKDRLKIRIVTGYNSKPGDSYAVTTPPMKTSTLQFETTLTFVGDFPNVFVRSRFKFTIDPNNEINEYGEHNNEHFVYDPDFPQRPNPGQGGTTFPKCSPSVILQPRG